MGYWGRDWDYERKARRPANGIKAQSGRQFGKTWWAGQWLAALERLIDAGRLSRGRSYARSGQVLNLDIQPGQVKSRVQGSRPSPYQVTIEIEPLTDQEWDKVAGAMAEQAIFAAKLLAGEMPPNIQEAFTAAHVSLFPSSRGDLETECSCPDWSNPCKHIAAVYLLLGEQFDADPFLIFRLRGKSKDKVMAMLRARRTIAPARSTPEGSVPSVDVKQEPVVPLGESLERFWDAPDHLYDFEVSIQAPAVDAVPVKRLGEPGFWRNGKVDILVTFSRAFRSISDAGVRVALGNGSDRNRG